MSERTAFVTGAARGIGHAIAETLVAKGNRVVIGDLRLSDAESAAGEIGTADKALGVELDVTDMASVQAAIRQAEEAFGPIEILVNNAGWDELHPFVETEEPFWDRVIDVNYKGVLRTTATVLPGMIEREWGRLVNIASDAARVGSSFEAVYAGAKGGVVSFTKTIAREVARNGIAANVVCPGPTDTALLAQVTGGHDNATKMIEKMAAAVPMKRIGKPTDIAAAVGFLCSDEAGFITGQTLSVSGGLTMAG
jgi:2-hydroxycyclohexanecarboxyl-CoA dehydrogenase